MRDSDRISRPKFNCKGHNLFYLPVNRVYRKGQFAWEYCTVCGGLIVEDKKSGPDNTDINQLPLETRTSWGTLCSFRFKSKECGYTGPVKLCSKTVEWCNRLGNIKRFPYNFSSKEVDK